MTALLAIFGHKGRTSVALAFEKGHRKSQCLLDRGSERASVRSLQRCLGPIQAAVLLPPSYAPFGVINLSEGNLKAFYYPPITEGLGTIV